MPVISIVSFSEDGEVAYWNRSEETLPPKLQIEQELWWSILFLFMNVT